MPRTRAFRLPVALPLAGLLIALLLVIPAVAPANQLPVMFAPTGAASGDFLGWSVASAGDVNGDGYADVIAGAWANDTGGTNSGVAYIYFGGPKADDAADVTLLNIQAGGTFGLCVGTAGDVNGDGYDDVIVGAGQNDAGGAHAGQAFVFFGGPAMDAVADVTLTGEVAGDNFGGWVGTAGDMDHDGYDDVIVGASENDAGGTDAGRAYVYRGGPGMDAVADLVLTGQSAGDGFGARVAKAGDVNGDHYADVIVGAPSRYSVGGAPYAGQAYVFFGGTSLDATPDLLLYGATAYDQFGSSVGTAGDVNHDSHSDVIVGAMYNDAGGTDAGRAYLYLGGASPNNVADLVLTGLAVGDHFGCAVGTAGDVNGDGYADILVGAPSNDAGGTDAGALYVFLGGPALDKVADRTLVGLVAGDELGFSAGVAGDVNADGYDDLVGGAPNNDLAGGNAGRAYILDMGSPPAAACRQQLTPVGAAAGDRLGFCVADAGDVNGDSYDDVIVGVPRSDPAAGTDAGRAYVYFGGPTLDTNPDLRLSGAGAGDEFGSTVAGAGDVNGDGYDDVIVGAPFNDAGGTDAGRAYVYFGGATPNSTADLVLTGQAAYDWFGFGVGTAGDMNGDGYADLVVGADRNDAGGTDAGRAYIYFGGASPDAAADLMLAGAAANDELGWSVGTAGDVNRDGYDDVIVGAHLNDGWAGVNSGAAYVLYGGAAPNAVVDLTLHGKVGADNFGYSVGTAGDVNGDGYDDMVVGAYYSYAGGANSGQAYVYFGGAPPDTAADVTMTGAAAGDVLGCWVGTAGDVNGDGYADVVIGAYGSDVGGSSAGQAYVYYGGVAMDGVADHALTGAAASDLFGRCVSTAGDVNGDGFADVIVGAYGHDTLLADAGAAYLYDFNRYFVTSPNGGETWTRNAHENATWLGAEPADLSLSVDDGATYDVLAYGIGGVPSNMAEVNVPNVVTDLARVKLTPFEVWTTGSDISDAVFTIQSSTGVEPGNTALQFRAPWPNPSYGLVRFGIELARPSLVTVTVLDVAGREVARPIAAERFEAGKAEREWRPDKLAPGVYTVRAAVGDVKLTRRLVWLGGR
jgi:hypothetical protein